MAEAPLKQPRLEVNGLRCGHGDQIILRDLDLQLGRGETLGIIGQSGCGKSTLLRCLSLLQNSDAGRASLDGEVYLIDGQAQFLRWQLRQRIVMVYQDYNLFPNMTCLRNITLALEEGKGMQRSQAEELAQAIAERLGIGHVLKRYPESLSGGQAQRLALARAMVLEPKVLLLDEITSGLDPETIVNVVEAIRELRSTDASGELAIIIVTHLMHFAAEFADRIAFMHAGKIHEDLPAKDFFSHCQKEETKKFVSTFNLGRYKSDLG